MTKQLSNYTRRSLLTISESALRRADVLGVIPTPLEEVARTAGVRDIVDISQLPDDIVAKKPSAWRRIVGAYLFREAVQFIDRSQSDCRERFTIGHETGHKIVPWHGPSYKIDDEDGLFREARIQLEAEANLVSSYLIFQGMGFMREALAYEVSIETPLFLADRYGASRHAAIHYYAEHHPDPIAVAIVGRYPGLSRRVPVWNVVASPAFFPNFGNLDAFLESGMLNVGEVDANAAGTTARRALVSPEPVVREEVGLVDINGKSHDFYLEGFFNLRCVFLMLSPKTRLRGGRPIRVEAA